MTSERKNYYHRLQVTATTQSTSVSTGALVVDGGLGIAKNLSVGGSINVQNGIQITTTTPSTSSSTGAFLLSGGLGISHTSDATSYTSGGALSIAGGASIEKRLFVQDSILTRGPMIISCPPLSSTGGSLTLSLAGASAVTSSTDASTFSIAVNSSNQVNFISKDSNSLQFTQLQVDTATNSTSVKSKQSATLVKINPNREDAITEQTYTNNTDVVSTPESITGLQFTTSRMFICTLGVLVDASTPLSCLYDIRGVRKGNASWELSVDEYQGDVIPISFSITSGGQIQYTKVSTPGHVSTTIAWSVKTVFDI